jgi:hypothetical protein
MTLTGCIPCPTTVSTMTMDCLSSVQGTQMRGHLLLLAVADQFDRVFQMGRPDKARSCLSPGSRADHDDVGGGSEEDKNDSMASLAAPHAVGQNPRVNWRSAAERQR